MDWDALETHVADLPQGRVHYRETGSGETLLFIHGILVHGELWHKVVPALSQRFRCILPDLPLGAHAEAMNRDADLTPPGQARIIADLMAALDLRDVTIVANDTGGALTQIVLAHHPERVKRVVLTNCDAYENFLPKVFWPLQALGWIPGATWLMVLAQRLRLSRWAFLWLVCREPTDDRLRRSFGAPARNRSVRRDVNKMLRGIHSKHTKKAAESFGDFDRPVLLAWGDRCWFFSERYAERLAADFPNSRIEPIAGAGTFVPLDRPHELARAVIAFCDD